MDPQRVELSDYVNSLRRRRRLILWIWVPLVLVTMLFAVGLPSEYGSTATFQLRTDLNDRAKGDNYTDRYISGLAGTVLGSPELRATMTSLAPYPWLKDDPGAASKKVRQDVNVKMLTQKILDPLTGLERKLSTGFTVTYTNRDPETAQRVAAWLANAFLVDGRRAADEEVLNESHFYAAEAERQLAKITQAEVRLAQFKQDNFDRLPDTVQANLNVNSLAEQDLEGVEQELRAQEQNRTFILQQLQQARATGANKMTVPELPDLLKRDRPVIRERDQSDYATRTPAVVQLQTQLNGVETQIGALERQLTELREKAAKLQSMPEVEVTYYTLTRDVATARQLYYQLNGKRADADIRAAAINIGTADRFTLVAPPLVPKTPTKPPRIGIALIGLIGATFLALMVVRVGIAFDRNALRHVRGERKIE